MTDALTFIGLGIIIGAVLTLPVTSAMIQYYGKKNIDYQVELSKRIERLHK